jgi:ankyrin repeat protein
VTASGKKRPGPAPQDLECFILAAREGDADAVSVFLKKFGNRVIDSKNTRGDTALTLAARFNRISVVRALLATGAGVDVRDAHRATALMAAAVGGHVEVIKELLARGADVAKKSYAHKTALWYAEVNKHPEAAALIADAPRQRAEAAALFVRETARSLTKGLEKPLGVSKPLRLAPR